MQAKFEIALTSLVLCILPSLSFAQINTWQLVAAEPTRFAAPELPVGVREFFDESVGDYGLAQLGFRVLGPAAAAGYWVHRNGVLVRYTQLNSSGLFGPNRAGAESSHQFDSVRTGLSSIAPDGQRSFLGRAGDPANAASASNGIWRWDGGQNIEIARGGASVNASGLLGPGLGADWRFINSRTFVEEARMLQGGQVLIHADVFSASDPQSRLLARHVPGVGNQPCMRIGATDGILSPGLEAGDKFQGNSSPTAIGVAVDGRVYVRNVAVLSGPRLIRGIWEICNGPPRAVAVIREGGARGPDIGVLGAQFADFKAQVPPLPDRSNGLYFLAEYCRAVDPCDSPVGVPQVGLFHHKSGSNVGIAYNDANGFYAPNWMNSTWKFFDAASLSAAGAYTSFISSVTATDTTERTGLWRVRSGQRPELAAMLGSAEPAYAPEAGRTWASFAASAVFSNGDVVLAARTNPGDSYAIWLLARGQAPRRVLAPGQVLTLLTPSGPLQETLGSFALPAAGGDYASGKDDWIAADGTLFLRVRMVGDTSANVLISTKLNVPDPFAIFADGFE